MYGKITNLIVKNNCLDVMIWPNHMRVTEEINITKAFFQSNFWNGFKLKKKNTICRL